MTTKPRRWTDAQRAQQAQKMHERRIWQKSTGPKSPGGKAASATNAYKHGLRSRDYRALCRALRLQAKFVAAVLSTCGRHV